MKRLGNIFSEMKERWSKEMPQFFYSMTIIALFIAVCAWAVSMFFIYLGEDEDRGPVGLLHNIICFCLGVGLTCKFTAERGKAASDKTKKDGRTDDADRTAMNMSDIETQQPMEGKKEKEEEVKEIHT